MNHTDELNVDAFMSLLLMKMIMQCPVTVAGHAPTQSPILALTGLDVE